MDSISDQETILDPRLSEMSTLRGQLGELSGQELLARF